MAYLDQLTDEERREQQDAGSAPAMGAAGSAPTGSSSPAPSSGFTNLSNYFTANREAAGAQGAAAAERLTGEAETALRSDSPGEAQDVAGSIDAASTPGGLATVLQRGNEEDPGYTAGMAGLDAYLGTRGSDPGAFAGLRELYGERLGNVEAPVGYPTPSMPLANYSSVEGGTEAFNAWNDAVRDYIDWRVRRARNIDGTEIDPANLRRDLMSLEMYGGPQGLMRDDYYYPDEVAAVGRGT